MIEGRVVLGITHGDANGIGYEVMLRALQDARFAGMFVPVIYGSGRAIAYYRKVLGLNGINVNVVRSARQANPHRINLVDCSGEELLVEMGQASRASGESAYVALERFFLDWHDGDLDGLVTLPVNKATMQCDHFSFPGHTEYLASKCEMERALMLMVSDRLRLGVVTGHVPLRDVPGMLTQERILASIRQLDRALRDDFEIDMPRIAVLGLNPHSGEGGLLGHEEQELIEPAIAAANAEGLIAVGPFASDGFFGAAQWRDYDAVLAMYHDQGLGPFKALSFDEGVNYTASLPLVRTSPAHGTAYDLVGKGIASTQPFQQAVYLAIDIVNSRQRHRELAQGAVVDGVEESDEQDV